jgi:conjugal transfer/entry exclusion protein
MENLGAEASRIDDLAAQSQNATGALQAQQAGNQINVELAQQLVKQRAQQLLQSIAENTAALAKQQERESNAAVQNMFVGGSSSSARGSR